MVVCRSTSEIKVAVAPARMFKALFLDSRNILPKVVPQSIKSIDIVQGQAGAAGCVEQINFPEGSPFKYIKNKTDHIDEQSLVCKYTMIEGDMLGDQIESIVNETKCEASGDGGCVVKINSEIHTKGDHVVHEEEIKQGNEQSIGMYKAVEAYLQANPTACA